MIALIVLALLGVWLVVYSPSVKEIRSDLPQKLSEKLDKLWDIAQDSLKDRKYLRAEKALLTILRVDERNAAAYNRLGILYAKQRAYSDAIECFEIAQSLEPSASSLHNVGLIYFETEKFDKAAIAFEQALAIEEDLAARHIAYAKVLEKLENTSKMLTALERAVELEPGVHTYRILADAYNRHGREADANTLQERIVRIVEEKHPRRPPQQKRRVIM